MAVSSAERRSTAVIVRTRLPASLEMVRRRSVPDAISGLPAHLTMLFPFVDPAELRATIRSRLEAVARAHDPFDYALAGRATWPAVVYGAVDPVEPFRALQADLAAAFPTYPIYDHAPGFVFVPHVTVAEGDAADDPTVDDARAWSTLPVPRRATALEVIVEGEDGRWRTRWRIRLGRASPR